MKNFLPILICFLIFSCQENKVSEDAENVKIIDSLKQSIDSLRAANLDILDQLSNIKISENGKDLPFEADFIKEKLRQNAKIIKMQSVLGGTMYFSNIRILNGRWILAIYEDGHVQGVSLIRYDATADSSINFKVLDSIEHY